MTDVMELAKLAQRECKTAMLEFPEDGELPKAAVVALMELAWWRGASYIIELNKNAVSTNATRDSL